MRHFSLLRFLTVSSFATSSPEGQADALAALHGGKNGSGGKSSKLQAALSEARPATSTRRAALATFAGATTSLAFLHTKSDQAQALDMDAFMNSELEKDTKNCDAKKDPKCAPKMTPDEAMCKYGQSGDARGEACKRFKSSGGALSKPGSSGGSSPGGAYAM